MSTINTAVISKLAHLNHLVLLFPMPVFFVTITQSLLHLLSLFCSLCGMPTMLSHSHQISIWTWTHPCPCQVNDCGSSLTTGVSLGWHRLAQWPKFKIPLPIRCVPRSIEYIVESCPLTKLNGGLSWLHSAIKTLFRG